MSQPTLYWFKAQRGPLEVRNLQGTSLESIKDAAKGYSKNGWRVIEWGKYVSQPLSPEELSDEPRPADGPIDG